MTPWECVCGCANIEPAALQAVKVSSANTMMGMSNLRALAIQHLAYKGRRDHNYADS